MDKIIFETQNVITKDVNKLVDKLVLANAKKKVASDNKEWIPDEAKRKYHEQRLGQSKWAFRLSLWGSIIGFGVIIYSTYIGIKASNPEWAGIIAGTIIEAVSALFYTLSNNTNKKISEFFEELTRDSNRKDAINLVKDVSDVHIKDELLVKLSLHLSGIDDEKICKNTKVICQQQNIEIESQEIQQ